MFFFLSLSISFYGNGGAIKLLLELLAHSIAIALGNIFHLLTKSSAVLSHMMFTTKMYRSKVPGAQHLWILVLKKKGT